MAEKEYTPSLSGSIFAGIACAIAGIILAGINLAFLPVSAVKELPLEEDRGPLAVYYIAGEEKGGSAWKAKKAAFEKGKPGTFTLSEGELNQWARTTFKPSPKKSGGESFMAQLKVVPATPNFRIAEDTFQLSSQLGVPIVPSGKKFLFQAQGTFSNDSGAFEFSPYRAFIGACPIPPVAGMPERVFSMLSKGFLLSDEYSKLNPAWNQLSEVSVEGDKLKLASR